MGSISPPRALVFCFAGQGYVPLEASRDLYRTSPIFRDSINKVAAAIKSFHETENEPTTCISLPEYFMENEERPAHTPKSTPESTPNENLTPPSATIVIFAAQYALAKTLQSLNLHPTAVIGYSLGEHIGSMVTGSLPLSTGIRLLLRRDKLFSDKTLVPEIGGMVTVQAPPETTTRALAAHGAIGDVEISGYPHKKSVVISGKAEALDAAQEGLKDCDIGSDRRDIELGMHSSHVAGVAGNIRSDPERFCGDHEEAKVVEGVEHWSCLGTKLQAGTPLNAKYWACQLVTPIHFRQCVEGVYEGRKEGGEVVFLDLGMGPRLGRLVQNTLGDCEGWKEGRVWAVSCVQPMGLDGEVKGQEGWAMRDLMGRVEGLM